MMLSFKQISSVVDTICENVRSERDLMDVIFYSLGVSYITRSDFNNLYQLTVKYPPASREEIEEALDKLIESENSHLIILDDSVKICKTCGKEK